MIPSKFLVRSLLYYKFDPPPPPPEPNVIPDIFDDLQAYMEYLESQSGLGHTISFWIIIELALGHHHSWYRDLAGRAYQADKGPPLHALAKSIYPPTLWPLSMVELSAVRVTHFRPSCIVWHRKPNPQLASGAHGSVNPAGST